MTRTDSSHASLSGFDSGPLSWVMVEIREALGRSRTALFEAGGRQRDERDTALQHAKSHLHQAHGALLMVDVDGVGQLTQAAEQALERFKDGTLDCSVGHAQVVADLYQALIEYLEELLSGAPFQPVRLFPYYRALQEMLGNERYHPADLFFPNLQAHAEIPLALSANVAAPDYPAYRKQFEKSLLPFLKAADSAAQLRHAEALQQAVSLVADAQTQPQARTFWFAMQSFAELVAGGKLASSRYVKQLLGLINLQMGRLAQGTLALPDSMLRDALFFIASVEQPSGGAEQLRRAYRLDGMVPRDFEARRYGQLDVAALDATKQALQQAKNGWSRLSEAGPNPALEAAFGESLGQVARHAVQLKLPALAALMGQLQNVVGAAVKAGHSDELGLEMATALLFAEHGLEQIRHLPDDFVGNAETIGARLAALGAGVTPPAPSQWQGDLSRQMEQDQTVAVLAVEMKTGLRQVEKILDDYYSDAGKRPALAQIDPLLHQLQGALSILDQDDALRAAEHVRLAVQQLVQGAGDGPDALDAIAQNVGALGFFVDMLGHNAEAARGRFRFDEAEGSFRAIPFEKIAAADPVPLLDEELAPPAPPPAPELPVVAPAPDSEAAVEAELLEIFISEATEVLGFVAETLAKPRAFSATPENLTMLRRSFHTLKGSGRMVGLNRFAEGGAAVERCMNVWLAEERPATEALFALLEYASADMGAWVAELNASGQSSRSPDALVAAAERVQEGAPFEVRGAATTPDVSGATEEWIAAALPGDAAPEELQALDAPEELEELEEPEALEPFAAESLAPLADNVIDFPSAATASHAEDNIKRVGELEISLPLYTIYLAETDELVRLLGRDFGEWRHEQRPVSGEALHAAHTLAGTSGTVGFQALSELAHGVEMVLESLQAPAPALSPAQHDLLQQVVERISQMLQSFALGELAPAQPELIAALRALRAKLSETPAVKPEEPLHALEDPLAQAFAVSDDGVVSAAPAPVDEVLVAAPPLAGEEADGMDALFAETYDSLIEAPPLPADAAAAETAATAPAANDLEMDFDDAFAAPLSEAAAPALEPVGGPVSEPEPAPVVLAVDTTPVSDFVLASEAEQVVVSAAAFSDELDADLLPVFLEEGADLLPQIGEGLRNWQHNPADTSQAQNLLRVLHTVKGSARMAGAMRLGQHAHEIETHIENMVHAGSATPHAFDELLGHYDHALVLFEHLQNPEAAAKAMAEMDKVAAVSAALAAANAAAAPGAAAAATPAGVPARALPRAEAADTEAAAAKVALVRVRADILDSLVNQAGEVSISRSKLENQVGGLRSSLSDFSENLARLRRQLREVEVQAESQIASRMAISSEREFDPLEFDRFTRLQELTRMMAESVNDVASFHENLTRSVDSAGDDLLQQARLTRDLQRDLMRVRMVPFASVSERLFRVARQSAKEVDKRVNLDIRGGAVEVDRSVLERMVAPFEHLLRNAIVHGVETRAARTAAGKNEIGELLVSVSQQGNEVVIEFSDDGGGLDLVRIRAKARSSGLIGADEEVSDAAAAGLIFEPGLSTAESLTELAGRGVGMDVVRSEAQSLGGRVDTETTAGKGTRFRIHLPLTLAVTQVVLLSSGGRLYALPSVLVEQVLQMKEDAVAQAHVAGVIQSQGQAVALHYLPTLLGDLAVRPLSQRSCPVMMLRSGTERLAVQVDEVLGNREVVIKNIGQQLSRMAGIAGATVLGNGEIVLILNPVSLSVHLAANPELRPLYSAAPGSGAPAGSVASSALAPQPQRVIMVVDDSLTVRRVSQRLLEREGYQVLLAKDGVDALEQLQGITPAMMLVDIEMPRMDGFDLTRNVRGDARTRDIPIIMITSRSADKHRNYAMELGVNAYFGKPFQEEVLLAAISGLLDQDVPELSAVK